MTMSKYDYGFALSEWDRSQSNPALNIQSGSVCSAPALLTQDELHVVQARSALCMCSRPAASRSGSAELQPSYSAAAERDSGLQNTVSRQGRAAARPRAFGDRLIRPAAVEMTGP